jgi:hypothetical protein
VLYRYNKDCSCSPSRLLKSSAAFAHDGAMV